MQATYRTFSQDPENDSNWNFDELTKVKQWFYKQIYLLSEFCEISEMHIFVLCVTEAC